MIPANYFVWIITNTCLPISTGIASIITKHLYSAPSRYLLRGAKFSKLAYMMIDIIVNECITSVGKPVHS